MSMSVKDIIREATVRFGLPRRQGIPGYMEETAYRLLKGIISKYNNDNLLSYTQNSITIQNHRLIHIFDQEDSLIYSDEEHGFMKYSQNKPEATVDDVGTRIYIGSENKVYEGLQVTVPGTTIYVWSDKTSEYTMSELQKMNEYLNMEHIKIKDVAKIQSIYLVNDNEEWQTELKFKNFIDFGKFSPSSPVFTYTPKCEGEWLIFIKPVIARMNYKLKINYNEGVDFPQDIDTVFYIPDNYIELLIAALAHKLALQFPRLDDAQMQRLENDVRVMVDNVRTPKAEDKILLRANADRVPGQMSADELMAGVGILGL
jgi:hypothetical protein